MNADRQFRADVLCADGADPGRRRELSAPAGADGGGQYVMPGGIDPHTHMQLPFMGSVTMDDFFTGTAEGLAGGNHVHHRLRHPDPQQAADGRLPHLARWAEEVGRRPRLHVAVTW